MIEIKKGKEPSKLIAYRKKKYAAYGDMPKDVHDAVLESLMQEQGYLCAYCMCQIPQKKRNPSVTIEHWEPQSKTSNDKALDYRNMLAVCNGNRGCGFEKYMTCDARRQNKALTVNPLSALTLSSIKYTADGSIKSDNPSIDGELNDILNLNCERLVENRKSALQTMLIGIKKKHPTGDIGLTCERLLTQYQSQSKKLPYMGILIWWLQKHTK